MLFEPALKGLRADFTSFAKARETIERLGITCSASTNGWWYNLGDGKFYQEAANTPRISGITGEYGLIAEQGQTNVVAYSSQDNAVWIEMGGGDITRATATSIMDGETAWKLTTTNTARCMAQAIGTFTTGTETAYVIVEQGDAETCILDIYDFTGTSVVCGVELTFSTESAAVSTGTPDSHGVYKLPNTGPNGGAMYLLYITESGFTSGNNRRVRFCPSTTSANKFTYLHHVQYVEDSHWASPIVTAAGGGSMSNNIIQSAGFLPDLGSGFSWKCTFSIYCNETGTRAFVSTVDGTANNGHILSVNTNIQHSVIIGGVQTDADSGVAASIGRHTAAGSHESGNTFAAADGTAGSDANASGFPSGMTRTDFGSVLGVVNFGDVVIHSYELIPNIAHNAANLATLS